MLTLVTGASGHIGSRIVKKLRERGRSVRVLVRKTSSLEGLKEGGEIPKDLEICYGELRDRESVAAALQGVGRLFHCGAVFKTRFADAAEMEDMRETNVLGTRIVLEAAAKAQVERIVYTSSVAAIGCSRDPSKILDEMTWNEDPIDAYVASKTESEKIAKELAASLKLPIVYALPATVIGPGDFKPQPNNDFILKAMQSMPPVYFANGHSYVDVDDVAEGHLLTEEKGQLGERYLLGGENVDIRTLFDKIASRCGGRRPFLKVGHGFVSVVGLGVELKAKLLKQKPLFTREKAHKLIDYYGYFSSAKANRELGYAFRSLDEILARCQEWYEERAWLGPRRA